MMNANVVEKIVEVWDEYTTGIAILATIGIILGVIAYAFCIMCAHALIVMFLWNWIAVGLFGAPVLGFWMAFGLYWLCSLLFRSNVTVNKKSEE